MLSRTRADGCITQGEKKAPANLVIIRAMERSASRKGLCHVAIWTCLRDMFSVAFISQICECADLTAGLTRKKGCELTDKRDILLCVTSTQKCTSPPAVPLSLTFGTDVMKSIWQNWCVNIKYFPSFCDSHLLF